MKMKSGFIVMVLGMVALFLAACSGGAGGSTSSAEYELRIAHTLTEDAATHKGLLMFKEEVEKRSDGRIAVNVFPNGQLYASERAAIEAVQTANIEMTVTATAPVAGFVPEFKVLDLPFIFETPEIAYEALDGEFGNALLELLPEIGLKGLVYGETGMRQITNNSHPIESPDDLNGLKMRTMENDVHIEAFKNYGANAEPFAFGELYSALQQNTFDGMENPFNLIDQMNFDEVQDYLTISNHAYTATGFFMNNALYEEMPDDLKTIIDEVAVEFRDLQRELAQQEAAEGLENIRDNMEINELTPEQRKEFMDQSEVVYEKFADEIGEELMNMANSIRSAQ